LPLQSRLGDHFHYFAHLHQNKEPEMLAKHTAMVAKYALKLINIHHLDLIVNRLIESLINSDAVQAKHAAGNFIKTLFWDAILFHDYGKVNETFQANRMQNSVFRRNPSNCIGSKHSGLSALIYIGDHFDRIHQEKQFNQWEKNLLGVWTLIFANVILKHHAPYLEHEINILIELVDSLHPYLKKFQIQSEPHLLKAALNNFQNESHFLSLMDTVFWNIPCFVPHALLRLCFSLLTAADYYATSSYTLDLQFEDFGTLTPEQKIQFQEQFRTSKYYNKEFFEKRSFFQRLPEESLMERSPENINLLRQKLMSEAMDNILHHQDERVFYLEAPTGSGKTNLSLAIALEMLKQNNELNKIFYVFPFTTLITQTANSIKETLQVTDAEMVQLHSRSGFQSRRAEGQEGQYGKDYLNFVDNLFVNYPLVLMTHIKFFEILKGNGKEETYILHRLANSVVIIDELQSYPPEEWDKIAYFISNYAYYFNIRFVLMSATLPKLDALDVPSKRQLSLANHFIPLLKNSAKYFQNPNFKNRVQFDFSLLSQKIAIENLADIVFERCEAYACHHDGEVKGIVEFIFKRRAEEFNRLIRERMEEAGYEIFLLSGTILEPRRKEIIRQIKEANNNPKTRKLLLITTQVVEAGVDIDMDIGFKHRSLIDSDEQLAGRVNRNAKSITATVYLFQLDQPYAIYGRDLRYRLTRDSIDDQEYQDILQNKHFDLLYHRVCEYINRENSNEYIRGLSTYLDHLKYLRFSRIAREFKLISNETVTIYVPLEIPISCFSESDLEFLRNFDIFVGSETIGGEDVWNVYEEIIHSQVDSFVLKRIDLKRIYGIMAQFMFSLHANSVLITELKRFSDLEKFRKYKILYLSHWEEVYDYKNGIQEQKFSEPMLFL